MSGEDLLVTTDVLRQPIITEQISKNVGLYDQLRKKGKMKAHKGGRKIWVETAYKENAGFQYQGEYERMSTVHTQPLTYLEYDITVATIPVTVSDLEEVLNRGDAAEHSILEARLENAEQTMINQIGATGIYSLGTDFGGKQLDGIQKYISDTPTSGTIGGKTRSTNSWTQNPIYDVSAELGTTASAANIKTILGAAERSATVSGKRPNMWVADDIFFGYYETATQAIQRTMSAEEADSGYRALDFHGSPFIYDGGLGGGCPASTAFGIYLDDVIFYYVEGRNMQMLPARTPVDQLASVRYKVFYGQLIFKRFRHCVRVFN